MADCFFRSSDRLAKLPEGDRRVGRSRRCVSGAMALLAIAVLSPRWAAANHITAFPGAEGFGKYARGGRGGEIIQVTTLADSGPGSLRACIDAEGPRVCVFRVSGVIRFTSERPIIRHPFITIAGQTAPGGGIIVTHAGGESGLTPIVVKDTHDVVIRNIRVRTDRLGDRRDSNGAYTIEASHDVILDHVSGAWALDENIDGFRDNNNVTISWSIFAEGIPPHDKCALLASDPESPQRLSFIKNICASNGDRNPDINVPPQSCVEVTNNVLYNAKTEFAEVWESYGGSPVNIVANYFKAGPDTGAKTPAIVRHREGSTGTARIYIADNHFDEVGVHTGAGIARIRTAEPVCPLATPPMSARKAYESVLDEAGALPRDDLDRRIVEEVRSRSGSIVSAPGTLSKPADGMPYLDFDEDGMSDGWERANSIDPSRNDAWEDRDGDGWSNLDEFLDYAHRNLLRMRRAEND